MPAPSQQQAKRVGPMTFWNISLDTANEFYTWGWRASMFGALITFFGGVFLYWGTRVRDHDFEHSMATLHKQAGVFEKEAANARLETEKLKVVVAWRTLSASQVTEFEKALTVKPGAVNLRWTDGDPEALFLATQISQVLGKARWQVAPGSFKPANSMMFGIVLPPVSGEDATTLREALNAAKITYSAVPISQDGAAFNVSTIPGAPFLMIGSRMPVVP